MFGIVDKKIRSKIMSKIRSKNTKPELRLRKALWALGYRYRIHYGAEKIDIAFSSKKLALFIDGCFWHMCPAHCKLPKTNKDYWHPKLRNNVKRDRSKEKQLKQKGWIVIRVWEHEVSNNLDICIKKIEKKLKSIQ